MEKQEFGFYVVHFFDQTYGIVNLDYIFEIEVVTFRKRSFQTTS